MPEKRSSAKQELENLFTAATAMYSFRDDAILQSCWLTGVTFGLGFFVVPPARFLLGCFVALPETTWTHALLWHPLLHMGVALYVGVRYSPEMYETVVHGRRYRFESSWAKLLRIPMSPRLYYKEPRQPTSVFNGGGFAENTLYSDPSTLNKMMEHFYPVGASHPDVYRDYIAKLSPGGSLAIPACPKTLDEVMRGDCPWSPCGSSDPANTQRLFSDRSRKHWTHQHVSRYKKLQLDALHRQAVAGRVAPDSQRLLGTHKGDVHAAALDAGVVSADKVHSAFRSLAAALAAPAPADAVASVLPSRIVDDMTLFVHYGTIAAFYEAVFMEQEHIDSEHWARDWDRHEAKLLQKDRTLEDLLSWQETQKPPEEWNFQKTRGRSGDVEHGHPFACYEKILDDIQRYNDGKDFTELYAHDDGAKAPNGHLPKILGLAFTAAAWGVGGWFHGNAIIGATLAAVVTATVCVGHVRSPWRTFDPGASSGDGLPYKFPRIVQDIRQRAEEVRKVHLELTALFEARPPATEVAKAHAATNKSLHARTLRLRMLAQKSTHEVGVVVPWEANSVADALSILSNPAEGDRISGPLFNRRDDQAKALDRSSTFNHLFGADSPPQNLFMELEDRERWRLSMDDPSRTDLCMLVSETKACYEKDTAMDPTCTLPHHASGPFTCDLCLVTYDGDWDGVNNRWWYKHSSPR